MGRYGNNVRRIAQTDELTKRVLQAEQKLDVLEKSSIPGARAIAYPSGGAQTGSPGNTNPDRNGSPDVFSTQKKGPLDGAGLDDGTTDGDDLLNGDKVLQNGEDPGAIALKDCDSGEEIDMRFNTAANEGESKFKHPDGWSITGPQNDPSYNAGRVWRILSGATAFFSNNFSSMVSQRAAFTGSQAYGIGPAPNHVILSSPPDFGVAEIGFAAPGQLVGANLVGGTLYQFIAYAPGVQVISGRYGQQDCGLASPGDVAACSASPPPQYSNWQEQDPTYKHQLAFSAQDGGFVSSAYDNGLPAKFRNDVGSGKGLNNVRLCTNDGNHVVVSALSDGTFAYFEEDGFGNPEEDAKVFHFDAAGKYQGIIRPDEYDSLKSTNNPAA